MTAESPRSMIVCPWKRPGSYRLARNAFVITGVSLGQMNARPTMAASMSGGLLAKNDLNGTFSTVAP